MGEDESLLMQRQDSQAQQLAEEHAGDALLEHLDARVDGGGVEVPVVGGGGEDGELVVEGAPFGVDDHLARGVVVFPLEALLDIRQFLDVRAVGARAEDGAEDGGRLAGGGVGARHEGADGVVDEGGDADGEVESVDGVLEELADVLADGVGDVEALGPADQGAAVDADLVDGEGEGEAELEDVLVLVARGRGDGVAPAKVRFKVLLVVLFEEELDLLGEEVEELLGGPCDH